MRTPRWRTIRALACALTAVAAVNTALADPPPWAGDKGRKSDQDTRNAPASRDRARDDQRGPIVGEGRFFQDRHRSLVHEYYGAQFRKGRCPPGLAKKRNGCMPPGQAKKWMMGQPLPSDVVTYDLPPSLVVQLGPPPSGHRYVRVATDILMIAIGTGMVVDAIQDIGR